MPKNNRGEFPFMAFDYGATLVKSISRQIQRSQQSVTILFTDVEGSTAYWDRHGDVKGRLMVDQHNRLVFPVIRRYRGRIVKTIGDSVMAFFKDPDMAVQAAIGIQQALEARRQQDRKFKLKVRIGVHTGKALVEHDDVFGDAVNVAARVESSAKGDEILVSGATAQRINSKQYGLVKKTSFTPKGKSRPLTVFRCDWKGYQNLVDTVEFSAFLPMVPRQKFEILGYAVATIAILAFLYVRYLRYVVADTEQLALLTLNPSDLLSIHPVVPWVLVISTLGLVAVIAAANTVPHFILRFLKGGFGFAMVFTLAYIPVTGLSLFEKAKWNQLMYQSEHLYVEIERDGVNPLQDSKLVAPPYERAFADGRVRKLLLNKGDLLLLTNVKNEDGVVWNKVLVASNEYAWLPRVIPPAMGRAEERISTAYKFYFYRLDIVLLILGFAGFFWGFADFRIKPI